MPIMNRVFVEFGSIGVISSETAVIGQGRGEWGVTCLLRTFVV